MPRKQPKSIRTTLTLPEGLWERIKEIGKTSHPEIPASQVVVLLLEHAVKEYQLVISVDIQKLHK